MKKKWYRSSREDMVAKKRGKVKKKTEAQQVQGVKIRRKCGGGQAVHFFEIPSQGKRRGWGGAGKK